MRTKLKPPTDYSGNDPIRYYLYDIALSLRLLTARKEPLSSAPEEKQDLDLTPGGLHFHATCVCEACKPKGYTLNDIDPMHGQPKKETPMYTDKGCTCEICKLNARLPNLPIHEYPIGYLGEEPEDLADDPRVKAAMAEGMLKDLIKQIEDTAWPVYVAPDWTTFDEKVDEINRGLGKSSEYWCGNPDPHGIHGDCHGIESQ